jgi:hypothetical protein
VNRGIRWRGWLMALAIFFAGTALGIAGTAWAGLRLLRQTLQASPDVEGPADRAAARIGKELTERLQLTAAESARVQAILTQSAQRMKSIRAAAAANARDELRAASAQIAAELPREKHADLFRVIAQRYHRLGLPPPLTDTEAAGR